MKTMTKIWLSGLCCGVMSVAAYAQDSSVPTQPADYEKEINRLKQELFDRSAEIVLLRDELRALKEGQSDNRQNSDAEKSAADKARIKELENQVKTLTKQYDASLKHAQDAADTQNAALIQQTKSLQAQHEVDVTRIAELTKELESLNAFKALQLRQMSDGVDAKWLSKPYADIDLTLLKQDYVLYEKFAPEDAKVAEARDKLRVLRDEVRVYDQANQALHAPYDASQVNNAAAKVKNLLDTTADARKRADLETLHGQLTDYGVTVKLFQELIGAVDKEIRNQSSPRTAYIFVEEVLKRYTDEEYVSAIRDIPWLAEQYDAYVEALKENCLAPNPARDRIVVLHP